jgi:D-alanine transaminase
MIVYFNGQYLEKSDVSISPDDRGFLFADGLYDVVHVYRGFLFRCAEHLDRLAHGLHEVRIHGCETSKLVPVAKRLLRENRLENGEATVYLQVTRGAAPRSHRFPAAGTPPTVYVEAKPFAPPLAERQAGAAGLVVNDERWGRCDIKTIGLLANTLAHEQARETGAFEAIFSKDGVLQEGSHSSIVFVKDGGLICPPLTRRILPSVTRHAVLTAAAREGIPIITRPCLETELADFEEVLMLGTAVEIVPLISINGTRIGDGKPGRIAKKLQLAFQELIEVERQQTEPQNTRDFADKVQN